MKRHVATIGMFDGVHLGHRAVVDQLDSIARRMDKLPLVVTFRNHPKSIVNPSLAPQLLMSADERKSLLGLGREVAMIDFDHELRQLTAAQFLQLLHEKYGVDTLLMGYNHRFGSDRLTAIDDYRHAARQSGIDIIVAEQKSIDAVDKISSTRIRQLLAQGDVTLAAKALGRHYSIAGKVVHGNALGRTIGFPTANVEPLDSAQLIPATGVYACYVTLPDNSRRPAMVNIGTRPTVDPGNDRPVIEAHLIDYDEDLYGQTVKIEFVARLRDEQRFASMADLRTRLQQDLTHTREALRTHERCNVVQ